MSTFMSTYMSIYMSTYIWQHLYMSTDMLTVYIIIMSKIIISFTLSRLTSKDWGAGRMRSDHLSWLWSLERCDGDGGGGGVRSDEEQVIRAMHPHGECFITVQTKQITTTQQMSRKPFHERCSPNWSSIRGWFLGPDRRIRPHPMK